MWRQTYGIKDHSDSERGNLPPHGLLFSINSKGYFICTIPQTGLHIPRPLLHQYHTDSERGNPLPPHGLLFSINSNGLLYMHHPTDRITHIMALVTPVVVHWLEREIDILMKVIHIMALVTLAGTRKRYSYESHIYIYIYIFFKNVMCIKWLLNTYCHC